MWYQNFDTYMLEIGFTQRKQDHYVYFKLVGDFVIYLILYVNYMLLIGNDREIIDEVKSQLCFKFYMKDFIATHFILAVKIKRDQENMKLLLSQMKYVNKIM